MSEIRLDRVHNQYVLIAPERLHRPSISPKRRGSEKADICPLCEGNEHLTPNEIFALRDNGANNAGWQTRVVPNIYKAVQIELADISKREGMFESIPGVGAHEIIIDGPSHDSTLKNMKAPEIENWLRTIIIRMNDLQNDKRLVFLTIFKNNGKNAGATQEHPHTQLIALPIMTQNEIVFLERNMRYYRRHGRGILEDVLQNELSAKVRVIHEVGNFVAYCPFASSFPFEVMIVPTINISSLNKCSRKDTTDLSIIIKKVFKSLHKQLGRFDYNLYFKNAPLNTNFENETYMGYLDENYRFSLRVTPRIYRIGGFEVATTMFINSVSPEDCAKLLKGE
ncbi:MAG: galactose-1-phosphate uridylyltransferase [Sulfurimonadaceae bacterium]|jgi:UDPglucose--hexose-1-phosphate uridylyltransferase|nr:galactose-1-phosphate uridylyltransferase [Sulfurimonadaceae bacterium]